MKRLLLIVVFTASLSAMPALAGYTFLTLDDPDALPGQTFAYGINDAGQVAGWFNNASGSHGFIYESGTWTTLDNSLANPGSTLAYVPNDSGQVLGNFYDAAGGHFAVYDGATWKVLGDDPDAASNSTNYTGINDAGVLSGDFHDSADIFHAFLYAGGTYMTLDYPETNVFRTIALGLNDAGAVTGYYNGPLDHFFAQHGFIFDGTTWTGFDVPDAAGFTNARAINDTGLVAGDYSDANQESHGFVYNGTVFTEFDEPDGSLGSTLVFGINDAGTIVGRFNDAAGTHGFLATPVSAAPEPPAWALMIASLAVLGYMRRCAGPARPVASERRLWR